MLKFETTPQKAKAIELYLQALKIEYTLKEFGIFIQFYYEASPEDDKKILEFVLSF